MTMNKIEFSYIKTVYNYKKYYCLIDGKCITKYVDEFIKNNNYYPNLNMLGLLPTWTGELMYKSDNIFAWELIDSNNKINLPILVCEEDCDFSCIVIMVKIKKTDNFVYWNKVGILDHKNFDFNIMKRSGIAFLEKYTDDDWKKYGDNIALEDFDSPEFWCWVSNNFDEERIRQHRNYTFPYMQDDNNINWLCNTNWTFQKQQYDNVFEKFREIYNLNK